MMILTPRSVCTNPLCGKEDDRGGTPGESPDFVTTMAYRDLKGEVMQADYKQQAEPHTHCPGGAGEFGLVQGSGRPKPTYCFVFVVPACVGALLLLALLQYAVCAGMIQTTKAVPQAGSAQSPPDCIGNDDPWDTSTRRLRRDHGGKGCHG
eukprot:CAMPEP_0179288876 /NCGR_PEP_ID=MMETSP0797-20121207/41007_1 /TAXON_ID=47934 /ORGANISM="Dinophysis acuminata, Strain DAEP01" /LENGTH=150 /DNA_ID=CAMNT_0020997853 /DNA_START=1 /DNA_END=449 /DNA_ORIENTATION=+